MSVRVFGVGGGRPRVELGLRYALDSSSPGLSPRESLVQVGTLHAVRSLVPAVSRPACLQPRTRTPARGGRVLVKLLSSKAVHSPDPLTRGVNLSSASLRVPPPPASDSAPPSAPRSPRAHPGGGGPSRSCDRRVQRRTDVQPCGRREPRRPLPRRSPPAERPPRSRLPAAVPVSHALRTKLFCCQV